MGLNLKSAKYNYLLLYTHTYPRTLNSQTNILLNQSRCLLYLVNIVYRIKLGIHFDAFVE